MNSTVALNIEDILKVNPSNHSILKTRQLTKKYQSGSTVTEVLKGVDLQIPGGEIVVIMGPSGVGKSTLLNLIGTLDTPTSGKIYINGEDTSRFNEQKLARFRNEHIGLIFQFHYLMPEFTALENVLIPRMIRDKQWKSQQERAAALLKDVGLAHRLNHKPNQLSGGEQQRVAIARSLMNQPKLILADEPTGDLDRINSQALFELIIEMNQKYYQTFIIVTHDEMFADKAHRIIHLYDGRVKEEKILK